MNLSNRFQDEAKRMTVSDSLSKTRINVDVQKDEYPSILPVTPTIKRLYHLISKIHIYWHQQEMSGQCKEYFFTISFATVAVIQCDPQSKVDPGVEPKQLLVRVVRNSKYETCFGLRLEKKRDINLKVALSAANKSVSCNKNFVCSPLGIHFMLSILANGSTGETRNQIYKYLGSKALKQINHKASEVLKLISSNTDGNSKEPVVSFVSGAWVDLQSTSLKPSFQKLLHDTYEADARALDFQNKKEACKEVNQWVSEATRGTITELLSSELLNPDTILVLGNALFFKASWEHPFQQCVNKDFHLLSGKRVQAPFMTTRYRYMFHGACFDGFNLLRLPYKTGQDTTRKFAMYVFLPNTDNGLVSLMERFSKDSEFLHKNFELPEASLSEFWIPKFKFSDMFSVKGTLIELGLERMFKGVGELGKIVNPPFSEALYVSTMLQSSFVEVNEEGTVASSAMVVLTGGGGPPPNRFSFVADHPFLFTIREETSQVTFFVGTVLNPLA